MSGITEVKTVIHNSGGAVTSSYETYLNGLEQEAEDEQLPIINPNNEPEKASMGRTNNNGSKAGKKKNGGGKKEHHNLKKQ